MSEDICYIFTGCIYQSAGIFVYDIILRIAVRTFFFFFKVVWIKF